MHAENEREFELVLGNKQLLGLLFVTFVLLGVFFALGYAMGRNSAPGPVVDAARPAPAEAPATSRTPKPTAAEGPVPVQTATTPATEQPTAPAQPAPAPTPPPAQPVPPPADAPVAGSVIDPKPGDTYLQVAAVKRAEAELLVEVLARKGFHAALAPAPTEGMFRVLVGPVRTDVEQGKLKSDLEQAGFKPIPRRY